MPRQIVALIVCALSVFALIPAAGAHHSISARFDLSREVTVEGVVTQFAFRNPHSLIQIDSDAAAGETWVLQWHATQILRRHGYGPGLIKAGDRIVVTGNRARDGSRMLRILTLNRPADGFSYEANQAEEFLLGL